MRCTKCFTLIALSLFLLPAIAAPPEEGFVSLFNGKDMDGWQGDTKGYTAKDETIVCQKSSTGNLYTKKEYSDFEFRFEFKLEPGSNNGIGIRAPLTGDSAYQGMEVQILDDGDPKYKDIKDYQAHGSVYGVLPAKRGFLKKAGEWNSETIIAKGNHITVILNGETIVDGVADKPVDGQSHPGLARKSGYICFCGHGDFIAFRNLRIKELK